MLRFQYIGPHRTGAFVSRLRRRVEHEMTTRGNVVSASGLSATLAIEWCEENNVPFTLKSNGDRMFYYVEKGS